LVPLGNAFSTGFSGVFLFFVISGFIILTAHYRDWGRPGRIVHYLFRRVVRIYPFYWIVLLVWGGWRIFTGKLSWHELALNALFFEGAPNLIIPVSWTLRYEIIFYGLFATFLLNRKLGMLVFSLWLALQTGHGPVLLNWLVDPMNLLFMWGLATAAFYLKLRTWDERFRNILGWTGLVIGSLGFMATMSIYSRMDLDFDAWPAHIPTILGFGLSSSLLLIAAASPAVNQFLGKLRIMALIGNASYSIYLLHSPFGKMAWNLSRSLKPIWQGEPSAWIANLLLVWLTLFAVSAGILVHLKIEAPLLTFLRGKIPVGHLRV
jgi:peptidoglycan/LPS O-acetylase OafA/YrhL